MYKSPIEVLYGEMSTKIEGDILKAVQKYDIVINKEGLIRALRYDRHQYDKGYADGKADALESIVRCKDCIYNENGCCTHSEVYDDTRYRPNYFCADGERRTDHERKAD